MGREIFFGGISYKKNPRQTIALCLCFLRTAAAFPLAEFGLEVCAIPAADLKLKPPPNGGGSPISGLLEVGRQRQVGTS